MTFISERLAEFTFELQLPEIPADVVEAAIRSLADTLGCAIAARLEPDARAIDIVVDLADRDRSRQEATIIGGNWKTSLRAAALANCTMARFIDANDIYMPVNGSLSGSGHFSDAIPALVAAAESSGASGAALLEAIVVAYEVQAALADSLPWLDLGLHSVSQVSVAVSLAAGRLLGLNERQLAHSAALAITSGLFLESWLHPSDDVPAIKGGAPGLAAERGITCATLAAAGFTGPLDAFEIFYARFGGEGDTHDHCFSASEMSGLPRAMRSNLCLPRYTPRRSFNVPSSCTLKVCVWKISEHSPSTQTTALALAYKGLRAHFDQLLAKLPITQRPSSLRWHCATAMSAHRATGMRRGVLRRS